MVNTVSLGIIIPILTGAPLSITDAGLLTDAPRTSVIASTSQDVTLGFDLSSLDTREVVTDTGTFEAICIPGEGITYKYGMPMLPAVTRFVVVPARAGLELVVRTDEPRRVRAVHPPVSCLDEGLLEAGGADIHVRHDEGLYPPNVAEMSEPFVIRGVRLVKVTTYPIQYDPASGSYIHHEWIETEIRFTDDEPVNPARVPVRRNRSREFLKYMRALAINGDEVGRDDPDRDAEPEFVGHYLIVAHENCIQYAAPFIEWRRKAGYKVDILAARSPTDYNSVGNEIEDLYDAYLDEGVDPFEYILLIGDRSSYGHGPAPGWQLAAQSGHGDYAYALLEGHDDFPDVAISRWPGGSRNTLELMVGRTLMYEATPYMDDTS